NHRLGRDHAWETIMPIDMEWGNTEKTVIVATIDWPWDWNELAAAWKSGVAMMNSVEHPVHTIAVAKTQRFPVGNILSNLTNMMKIVPDNIGLAIMVTENRFQETINTIFFKLSPGLRQKGRVVNSLDKAMALVAEAERSH
ncbi:MAG: hypothetical protein K8I30_04855, partial [Anaerolineae bacterium]|nr:hypothetical protein [Anaerolineae bacterium]